MEDVFVAQVMSSEVRTARPETPVADAAGTMLEEDIGSLVVTDDAGNLEGILTTTDFVRIVADRQPRDETPTSDCMTADVVTTSPEVSIRDAADAMIEHDIHHLPVVDAEGVAGIVTTTDLAAYLSRIQTPSPS